MYSELDDNRFLEVTYANGDKEVLYFKDFNSGAMIQNIVDRAKKMAIKDFLEIGQKGIRISHLLAACVDEFKENEDLPNTTNPDDWARISGKKGERIVYIRTLITGQGRHRAGSLHRQRRQHRPVPLATLAPCRETTESGGGRAGFGGFGATSGFGVQARRSWNHVVLTYFPNLKPTSSRVPTSVKPSLRCRALLAGFGCATTETTRWT